MRRHIPLSQRSALEIRHQAERYSEMASSARTAEAKQGLEMLAARFAALAEQRQAQEQRSGMPGPVRANPEPTT